MRVRHDARLQPGMCQWKRGGRLGAERRQFGLCLLHRDAVAQAPEDEDGRPLASSEGRRIGIERYPVLMVDGKREPLWHHADNGVNDVAETELPSEHRRVTAESRLPHVVADHHDRRSVDVFIGFDNRASDRGRHAGDVEADGP